jgi:hypothetical protein
MGSFENEGTEMKMKIELETDDIAVILALLETSPLWMKDMENIRAMNTAYDNLKRQVYQR